MNPSYYSNEIRIFLIAGSILKSLNIGLSSEH